MIVGEMVMEPSLQKELLEATQLKGITLKEVLPDTLYTKVAAWFSANAGMELRQLHSFSPMVVMTVVMAVTQQKYFPNKPGEVQLDDYFQQQGRKQGKKVRGLETMEVQINALFRQMSLQRQVVLLNELFGQQSLQEMIGVMNNAYVSQDMNKLRQLMFEGSYTPGELKVLLTDRNVAWMRQLPGLMKEHSLFVAVGALHLVGEVGLVEALRGLGYTVEPVKLRGANVL
ncbi:MAG: TraB/GumN family protein [Flaviaesturariibacter sp.]|nr:TraB/GumN family protein [Flaviaesturariibacter sp.]